MKIRINEMMLEAMSQKHKESIEDRVFDKKVNEEFDKIMNDVDKLYDPNCDDETFLTLMSYAEKYDEFKSIQSRLCRKNETIVMVNKNYNPDVCTYCGRGLTNPLSISRGCGHTCGSKNASMLQVLEKDFGDTVNKNDLKETYKFINEIAEMAIKNSYGYDSKFFRQAFTIIFNKFIDRYGIESLSQNSNELINLCSSELTNSSVSEFPDLSIKLENALFLKKIKKDLVSIFFNEKDKTKFKYIIFRT